MNFWKMVQNWEMDSRAEEGRGNFYFQRNEEKGIYVEYHSQIKLESKYLASFSASVPCLLSWCKPIIRAVSSQQTLSWLSEGERERESLLHIFIVSITSLGTGERKCKF